MIEMRPKDAIKMDIVELDKSEIYPKEKVNLKDGLYRYLHQPGEQHGDLKKQATSLSGVKTQIG